MELYGPPRVGGDILAFCTRCRMELAHVIFSMVDRRPSKVICKTCKSQHNYKRAGASFSGTASPRSPRKPTQRSVVKIAELWEQKMAERKAAPMKPYSIKSSFTVGDVIQHPKFGMGVVEEVKKGGKITVLFRDDQKVLVHAPSPS